MIDQVTKISGRNVAVIHAFITYLIRTTMESKRMLKRLALAISIALLSTTTYSQVSFGLQVGAANSNQKETKNTGTAGLNIRYFISPQFALGLAVKGIGDYRKFTHDNQTLKYDGLILPVTGTLDLYLTKGNIKPYIGTDAGIYLSHYNAEIDGNKIYLTRRYNNFGVAPRLGIIFGFGNFGIQLEAIQHFILGNRSNTPTTGSFANINLRSTKSFSGGNIGVIFGLGKGLK